MKRLMVLMLAVMMMVPVSSFAARKVRYEVVDVANGGAIKGKITTSVKTKDPILPIDIKDKENPLETEQERKTCGESQESFLYVISPAGGVKNALVIVEGVKKGKAAPKKDLVLDNIGCRFEPLVGISYVKANYVIKNSDPLLHNTSLGKMLPSGVRRTVYNLALPHKDQIITKPNRVAGLLNVKCDAHPWMRAYIYSSRHPYVAITDENGDFEIPDLLPGTYAVRVWHEGFTDIVQELTVSAGKTSDLSVKFTEAVIPPAMEGK